MVVLYRLLFIYCLLFGVLGSAQAQSDSTSRLNRLLERFIRENRPANQPRFLVYPSLAYSPETSFELGVAATLLFHAKNNVAQNRLSEITFLSFVTLRSQYGIWIDNAVYTDKDRWLVLGRARVQRFPLLYYGVGPNTTPNDPDVVDGSGVLIRQRVFRKFWKNYFAGPQFDIQSLGRVEFGENGQSNRPRPLGAAGSLNIGLGLGAAYDSRPNALNTRDGWFAEIGWLRYSARAGSDFSFENFNTDIRWYKSMNKQQVLAAQFIGNIASGNVPFNQLSLLGNENMMRGYYTGRYRDRQYYATQVEYRWLPLPFSRRFGAAAFLATGAVAPNFSALSLSNLRLAGGAGIRFLLFPKKDIFVRFDVAFTREKAGFYLFTGEAF